jgi:hypothetical protein
MSATLGLDCYPTRWNDIMGSAATIATVLNIFDLYRWDRDYASRNEGLIRGFSAC